MAQIPIPDGLADFIATKVWSRRWQACVGYVALILSGYCQPQILELIGYVTGLYVASETIVDVASILKTGGLQALEEPKDADKK